MKVHAAILLCFLGPTLCARTATAQSYTFVGSWDLATIDGGYGNSSNPYLWFNNPLCYSGVSAAALLFGGSPADYVTSTVDSNPANINFDAFVDGYGYGNDLYLYSPAPDTFFLQTDSGYQFGSSFSAYVVDHAPFDGSGSFVNYAFRINPTPEPGAFAVAVSLGITGFALIRRRRRSLIPQNSKVGQ